MKHLTCALFAALCASSAFANEKPYVGIDYQFGNFQISSGEEANPETVRVRVGTEITPMLGVEAQAGLSASTDQLVKQGVAYSIKVDNFYGVFLRPQYSIKDYASIHALLGGSYVSASASVGPNSTNMISKDGYEKSFSIGAGLDFRVMGDARLSLDYIEYNSSFKAMAVGVRIPLN